MGVVYVFHYLMSSNDVLQWNFSQVTKIPWESIERISRAGLTNSMEYLIVFLTLSFFHHLSFLRLAMSPAIYNPTKCNHNQILFSFTILSSPSRPPYTVIESCKNKMTLSSTSSFCFYCFENASWVHVAWQKKKTHTHKKSDDMRSCSSSAIQFSTLQELAKDRDIAFVACRGSFVTVKTGGKEWGDKNSWNLFHEVHFLLWKGGEIISD